MNNKNKLLKLDDLKNISEELKKSKKKIVLCHGTFDILHIGHIKYLQQAKKNGDILIVTITADKYVLKGPGRPYFNEQLRSEMLVNIEIIDFVSIVHERTALSAIEAIKPNYYVKGVEYKEAKDDVTGNISIEEDLVIKYGGQLKFSNDIVFSS